jgi:hypothetical protein
MTGDAECELGWFWRRWQQTAGHGTKLGCKQEEAIAALVSQGKIKDAARVAEVGARTLLRWLKLPEFAKGYRQARREAVQPCSSL